MTIVTSFYGLYRNYSQQADHFRLTMLILQTIKFAVTGVGLNQFGMVAVTRNPPVLHEEDPRVGLNLVESVDDRDGR